MLEQAGFPTAISRSMDGWLKTHAVFISCVCAALALEGGDSVRLGQNRVAVLLMVSAIREGFAALQSLGVRVMPFNLKVIFRWMPRWFAVRYWHRAFLGSLGRFSFAAHSNAARDEMEQLASDVWRLVHNRESLPTPSLEQLFRRAGLACAAPSGLEQ